MIASPDVLTLVLVLAIGHAVAALLLYVDARRQGHSFDLLFAAGMALQGLGWTLISFRGAIPGLISFEAGNSLIFAGFCLEGIGLLSLVRPVDRPWRLFYGAVLILVLAAWWMPFLSQDQKMGSVSFVVPFFFIIPAAILVFSSPRPSGLQTFIGATLLLYVAATMARGAWVLGAGGYTLTTPAFFQVLFMLVQILEMILASTGYILIRKESVTADLEADMQERRQVEEEMLAQSDNLEERVKELRSLYQVSRIIEAGDSPDTILSAIADALPAGWKYPDLTCARIRARGREYLSRNFAQGAQMMASDIVIRGERAGAVEVFFLGDTKDPGKTPFLPEETDLLNAVAERISRVLERLEAEKALTESEEKYRALFEQVNDAIFIAEPATRLLTDCNRRAEELTGYTRDEIRGMPAEDLHPDDLRAQTMSRFQAFMEGMTSSIETEVITRFGRRVPVSINATPAEIGGSTFLIGIFRDITWQKEVEKAIREHTEEVDRFFSTSLDLFCIADTDGYFRRLNPEWEKTLGWPVKELEGKRFLDFVHPDDLAATVEAVRQLGSNKEVTNFINRYRHRDGTWRWIEWRSYPSSGRIFAAARDITQHHLEEYYTAGLSRLKQELLISAPLETKLRKITDACISLFEADFARVWITGPGDLCDQGCIHAGVTEGPDACPDRTACLHLVVSSGRYTRTDGEYRRVPPGASMICHVASGGEDRYITNDITHDPRVRDHNWAESLGLVSFAGFRLVSAEGKPFGVLALFSRKKVAPAMEKYLDDMATTASQVILSAATEDALRESEERFRRLLAGSFDAVVVHQDGRIVLANDAALRAIGAASPGEIIGRPVIGLVHPDFREAVSCRVREMLSSPEGTVPLIEEKFLRIDGTPITVSVMATRTQHNGRPAIMVVFRDVTEQKRAEDEIFQSRQMLQLVIDTIPQRVFWKDTNSVYLGCNLPLARDSGYQSPEEVIGKDDYATASREMADRYRADDRLVMETGIPRINYEEEQVRPDGNRGWLSTSKVPLRDRSGAVIGVLGTYEDVTERKQMVEALQESEARLRSILHGFPLLQFVLDKDHRVISWNRAIEEYSGIGAGEIIGTRDQWRAFYAESRPVLADILIDGRPDLLETWYPGKFRKSQYVEGAIEAEDFFPAMGKTGVWLSFTAAPIRDAGGLIIGAVETLEDITERRQMDGAVQAAVKLNQLIDSMSSAQSMTYTLDEAERLTSSRIGFFHFLNDDEKTIRLIAWSTETKTRCFIPKEPERHYPVETAGVWVDCIRERRPVIHNDYAALPGRKGLPEGHVPLARELVVPVFDGEKIVAIIGVGNKPADYTGRDIDILTLLAKNAWTLIRRKQTEEDLRESEEKYRNIIENIQDMVYRADMDGKFLMISPSGARLLGFDSPDQLIGRPVMDYYLNPEERLAFLEALRKDGSVYGYPILLKSVDGTVRHVMVSSHFFHDPDGNVQGVEGIIHDVTDLRRAEEALRSANRKLTLLSGITRHDIRNQLLALSGYLQISEEVLDDKEKVAEYIEKEQKIAKNIERQIAFTKDYEDLGVKSMEWQDISALVRDAAASLPVGTLGLDIRCAGLEVYADPLLRKVFYNLIDNSLHYGGETMTGIRVRVQEEEGGALAVIYEDDGAGISTEDKKKLFTKGFGKHTGLGLFLSREILSITGITITEDGEPGNGVRFVIAIPKGMFRFREG